MVDLTKKAISPRTWLSMSPRGSSATDVTSDQRANGGPVIMLYTVQFLSKTACTSSVTPVNAHLCKYQFAELYVIHIAACNPH